MYNQLTILPKTVVLLASVSVFSILAMIATPSATLAQSFGIEEIQLPNTKGGEKLTGIIAVAIDGKNRKIALAKPGMWAEMPQKGRGIDGARGFTAGTKGHVLTAAASAPRGVYVYDALSNTIMGESSKYVVAKSVKRAGGMAFFRGHIYLADADQNVIHQIKLQRGKAVVAKTVRTTSSVTGLASNSRGLFGVVGSYLVRFNDSLAIQDRYNLRTNVDGLTALSDTEFIATRAAGSKLYRISIP